jgi:hypothetical protein
MPNSLDTGAFITRVKAPKNELDLSQKYNTEVENVLSFALSSHSLYMFILWSIGTDLM